MDGQTFREMNKKSIYYEIIFYNRVITSRVTGDYKIFE